MWGLSNGVIVLTISSAFWLGLAAWTAGPVVLLVAAVPIVLLAPFLIRRGLRLRLLAPGFSRSSLRTAPPGSPLRGISAQYTIVVAAEWLGFFFVGFVCW